ncbi:MAG: amidohydrolase [Nocardiopsaceae bacterium]|jgi:predicted amidohydrolase YtcJ|nr:amidohydrolase [Nocardiopsaceae bacterium]
MADDKPQRVAFVGGRVWTAGYRGSRPLDVLVEADRIVEVAPAGALNTDEAEVHDLDGRLLTPGFQDAHIHLGTGGSDLLTCNLAGLETPEQIYAAISEYAKKNPSLPWITGGGWFREVFPYPEGPTRQKLDELVGNRRAYFAPYDRHGAWVSTAALDAARVDDNTPDPPGGFFRRDEHGSLTGMVEEDAIGLIRAVMPEQSTNDRMAAILKGQEYVLALGITSVQDALVGTGLGLPDHLEAYGELLKTGDLRLRLTTALWWDQKRGLEQIPEMQARRDQLENIAGPDRVIADTVKVMVDGADVLFMDADKIRDATVALDRLGFTVHYHSYGDAATRWILDAIETAIRENGPRVRRHHIAHLFVVAEEEFSRFAQLGVTANVQGFWAGSSVPHDHIHQSTSTDHGESLEYPFGRLNAAGAQLAGGSDWPVTTPDPLVCARTVNGDYIDPDLRKDLSELDRLDPVTMMTAYTAGSAFVNGRGATTGRIAQSFLADLVVLDRDIFESDDTLRKASVSEVWIGGQRLFSQA